MGLKEYAFSSATGYKIIQGNICGIKMIYWILPSPKSCHSQLHRVSFWKLSPLHASMYLPVV